MRRYIEKYLSATVDFEENGEALISERKAGWEWAENVSENGNIKCKI